ncbi:MAG: hypothetical protein U1E78_06410 [Gammaproteobacteria bacterium]
MQAGPLIRQRFGLDRTEWPFRKTLEAQLEQLHTEYLRIPSDLPQGGMPIKRAEFRSQPNQVEEFERSWIGRNLIAFGGTVARQYVIDDRVLEVNDQYRKVSLIAHDDGDFSIRQTYYASAKTGAKKDHHRWMKAAAQSQEEMPQYVKVRRKRMEAVGQRFYVDNINLDQFQPLLVIETRFRPEFKDHVRGEYLHAISLLEMTIQHDANLVQKPLLEPVPQRGWFNFGHDSELEAPVVQFNHLREEFEDALNDAERLQKVYTQLQAEHQALSVAKNKVDQTLLQTQLDFQESEKTAEALNARLEMVLTEKEDLAKIRNGLETQLEVEQTKTKQLTLEMKSLQAELQKQQKANQSLEQTLQTTTRDLNAEIAKQKDAVAAEQTKVQERDRALEVREKNIKDLRSDIGQRDVTIADLQKQIQELTESNKKFKAQAEAAATYATAQVKQLEKHHTRAFSDLEKQHQTAFDQQAKAYEERLTIQHQQNQDRLQEKDARIKKLGDALSASERQAKAERDNLNRKLDALIQAYAALKGAAESALRAMHTARVRDFAQLQMILNRSGFYDLMHAIKKPFVWAWYKLTRQVAAQSTLEAFAEPDFLKVDPRDVIAEVEQGQGANRKPTLNEERFDFSMPAESGKPGLTHQFDSLRSSNSGSNLSDQEDETHLNDNQNINIIHSVSERVRMPY